MLLAQAIINRGYTDQTHLRGFQTLDFVLVRKGGESSALGRVSPTQATGDLKSEAREARASPEGTLPV
ncbi:hypothetical protein JYQ62_08510 [Nostoc sp. UHCC 0702]|nr:hypothetical protein JYQ62_08510 [Nostoc sp. UHCC 0702]